MVKIIGHRGAAGYAPENTLYSFEVAIDLGCDRAELDVRLSKDGEAVVFHDEEISRIAKIHGNISDLTLAELKKLDLPNKQKIPTLKEVIDICKGKIDLQIELKVSEESRLVNQIISHKNMINNIVITSFDPDILQEMKRINPKLKVGLLFKEYSNDIWNFVKKIPLDFIGPKADIVTYEMVHKAHGLKKNVYAYHANDKKIIDNLIALGVDEIGTDFPKLLINS